MNCPDCTISGFQKERDQEKRDICEKYGIIYIEVFEKWKKNEIQGKIIEANWYKTSEHW